MSKKVKCEFCEGFKFPDHPVDECGILIVKRAMKQHNELTRTRKAAEWAIKLTDEEDKLIDLVNEKLRNGEYEE